MFNIKEIKSGPSKRRVSKINQHLEARDVYFFATDGPGIATIPLADLINWHFPIMENAHQPICKGFARFTLSDRQTTPTVCFKPSQILMVDDIQANTEPDDTNFEDPVFQGKPRKVWTTDEVMTDGCAMISVGVALLIREIVGIVDFPSTFQGRINGHKGLWHVSGPYETSNPKDLDVWIQLRPSQRKVGVRAEDCDERCEADRWSFDLVSWTKPATHAHIHKDFIPVLEDRGVPRETILAVIDDTVNIPIDEIQEAIQDTVKFTIWSHENFGRDYDDQPNKTRAGLPSDNFSKYQLLVNKAGYTPSTNHVAAKSSVNMIEEALQRMRSSMSFVCIQSTSVFGIADPYGVLSAGEVHLSLSRPLMHEASQQRFDVFAGRDVLVARDPTLRGSDMQKVRCVCHPKLAHLKDTIVMPSRGQIPLAAKLQGGDYDGDTFWVCADERLVTPFKNAPVLRQASIDELGIKQDKRRLRDIIDEENIGTSLHVEAWLKNVIPSVCRENQVGHVTNYLYGLIYHHKSLWHPHATLVADLHDAIMDAEKNGYVFGAREWIAFRRRHNLPDMSSIQRDYVENLKALDPIAEPGMSKKKATLRDVVSSERQPLRRTTRAKSHILDDVVFNVINPKYRLFLDWLYENVLKPAEDIRRDEDLEFPLRELEAQAAESGPDFPIDVQKEVQALKRNLEAVAEKWACVWNSYYRADETRREADVVRVSECIEAYRAIRPTQENFLWRMRTAETAPTKWECFKVAVLAGPQLFQKRRGLLFWAAMDVVQFLKSHSENGRRTVELVQSVLKPKRPKLSKNLLVRNGRTAGVVVDVGGDDDDDDDETTNDDNGYDDDVAGLDRALLESFGS